MPGEQAAAPAARKQALRASLLAARRAMGDAAREDVAQALALHLMAEPVVARARRVAAYRSMVSEPGTAVLLERLVAHGIEVVVPVVDGAGLDWVHHDPDEPVRRTALGIDEPTGPRLGPEALGAADVVVVPALAVDHAGHRLGRGAGYYDRTLTAVTVPVVAVVHARELLPDVPHEPHDVAVTMAATEAGVFRVP